MPYDVTAEAALKYEEVQKRLQKSITKLKQVTTMFLATIVKSGNKLPYGIQYMAKVCIFPLSRCPGIFKVCYYLLIILEACCCTYQ